ncbi:MAG: tRNA pseudouridine(55) synthase TruB [Bacteroidia bacterium]|jgi:tRNA pseudouridine55 synthase|nr:tRNA pseudouridine(55) synthase TruB [Bacteroidia bacterium]
MEAVQSEDMVLLMNKPLTWTSFQLVKKVKWLIRAKKVGHAGTLDPLATGLLVICTGKKTKTIETIQAAEKEYTGTFYIGATTPSFDLETERDAEFDISHITEEKVREVFQQHIGEIMQVPPMHSAVKLNGQRAYKLARRGEMAELRPKPLVIKTFELTRYALPEVDFRVVCSKGTYIRALARDIGLALGAGAHLTALCRTRIGDYLLTDALTVADLEAKYPRTNTITTADTSQSADNQ